MKARLTHPRHPGAGLAAAFALVVAACSPKKHVDRAPHGEDRAVARLNGAPVWTSDVRREAAAQGLVGAGEPFPVGSPAFGAVLEEVIDQKLLAAEAVRRGLDRDPDVRRRLAQARERVLADVLLETSVVDSVQESAVAGVYREMRADGQAPDGTSLEAARPRIMRFLTWNQVRDLILDLRHRARIVSLLPPPPTAAAVPAQGAQATRPARP